MTPTVIWSPQPGPQTDLITCPVFEVFYGGARGGGKTESSIGDWFSHAQEYGENAIGLFVRRKLTQLSEAIARCKTLGAKVGAKWYEQKKELLMPNGARLKFAYLERDSDAEEYQGHSYTRVYIEEVTNFPFPDPISKLKGTLRSGAGVRCGMRLTGNPGGPGHHWVKARYIDPCPGGYLVIKEEEDVEIEPGVFIRATIDRVFIPARLKDNRLLLKNDPTYIMRLRQTGSEALVKAWLDGDWSGVDGTFFSEFLEAKHVIASAFRPPEHWAKFRAMDWGSAKPFSVGWYTVSDGSFPGIPRDCLVKFAEWYGWNGQPNVGLKMSAATVAQGVLKRDRNIRLDYGVADPSIFITNGGPSIGEMMLIEGCEWFRADNARQPGWEQIRKRLSADEPLLMFTADCEHTIRTLPFLQHDDKNPEDLDSDAEDHCFVFDTKVLTTKGVYKIGELVSGEVPTLFGDCVYKAMKTGTQVQLVELRYADGSSTICTPSHKFLTPLGWVRAANLQGLLVCHQKQFPLLFKNTLASVSTCAGITFKTQKGGFIGWSGQALTASYRMATIFIIKTAIRITILWKTLSAYLGQTTYLFTPKLAPLSLAKQHGTPPRNGTHLTQGMFGTENNMKNTAAPLLKPSKKSNLASFVKKLFSRREEVSTNFARTLAKAPLVVRQGLTISQGIVAFAVNLFLSINTQKQKNAVLVTAVLPHKKADVYCLSVPKAGHFFLANGLVVSNCADETRYAVMSRPITKDLPKSNPRAYNPPTAQALPTINQLIARQKARDSVQASRY